MTLWTDMPALLEKTWQQIYLAGIATLIAVLLGVPLGIWIARLQTANNFGNCQYVTDHSESCITSVVIAIFRHWDKACTCNSHALCIIADYP